jgi:hypothetical protein
VTVPEPLSNEPDQVRSVLTGMPALPEVVIAVRA